MSTTEPGRISFDTGPATVLLAVPGFTRERADRVVELQRAGTAVIDLPSLPALVSRTPADTLLARFADIARITTTTPDAWLVMARASAVARVVPADTWQFSDVGRDENVATIEVAIL